ncbi:hypothetical protein QE152_g37226 [Popillia japonica]|uniref:Uncharacterized protein n=1 Tax=Popillia japonica TaxID=7064 RepID=A0AAW1IA99_POPJA
MARTVMSPTSRTFCVNTKSTTEGVVALAGIWVGSSGKCSNTLLLLMNTLLLLMYALSAFPFALFLLHPQFPVRGIKISSQYDLSGYTKDVFQLHRSEPSERAIVVAYYYRDTGQPNCHSFSVLY